MTYIFFEKDFRGINKEEIVEKLQILFEKISNGGSRKKKKKMN